MKKNEELIKLNNKNDSANNKFKELTEDELKQVSGGFLQSSYKVSSADDSDGFQISERMR